MTYGLSEYIGYQLGCRGLRARMRVVYAVYLFGAAAAYLTVQVAMPEMGVSRLLIVAAIGTSLAMLAIGWKRARLLAGVEILVLLVLLVLPNLDARFLLLYKGAAPQSTRTFEENGYELVYQKWGNYALCEIMRSQDGRSYKGFYNDFFQWEYASPIGFRDRSMGWAPLLLTRGNSHIAIIGAGGGRQVRFAWRVGHRSIVAIELEPAVIEAVRSPQHLQKQFDQVYEAPGVQVVLSEGRKYLENAIVQFDLIYLPSVGGYPQLMLEPGNLIRTYEAFETMKERLKPDGWIAIWYPRGLDAQGVLTRLYVRTLRLLEMEARAYESGIELLILARKAGQKPPPTAEELFELIVPEGLAVRQLIARNPQVVPRDMIVEDDPAFTPVTDDRPYLAGNVRHVLSTDKVYQLFGVGALILTLVSVGAGVGLRRRGNPDIQGRSYFSVVILALLLGANFLVAEHLAVLVLFKSIYVYYDALMLGAVTFLLLSGLGSIMSAPRLRGWIGWVAMASMIAFITFHDSMSNTSRCIALVPVAIASGTFFPVLFDRSASNPLAVFAMDALGAGFGALAATFIPIAFGFEALYFVAATLFLLTWGVDKWFHRDSSLLQPAGPPS